MQSFVADTHYFRYNYRLRNAESNHTHVPRIASVEMLPASPGNFHHIEQPRSSLPDQSRHAWVHARHPAHHCGRPSVLGNPRLTI